jgi:hypothetical protein
MAELKVRFVRVLDMGARASPRDPGFRPFPLVRQVPPLFSLILVRRMLFEC